MVCTYIFSLFNVNYTSITLYIVNIQETNYDVFYSNLLILENLLQNKYFHSHFSDGYYHNCVARCNFLLFHADVYQFAYMNYEMNLRKMTSFIYIIIQDTQKTSHPVVLQIKHLVHSTNCQKQLCNLRCGIQHLLSLHAFIIINMRIFILQMLQHDMFPPFKVKICCVKIIDENYFKNITTS